MKILDSNKHGKLNADQIKIFEDQFEILIPDEFKSHLLVHNGGTPFPADFNLRDNTSNIHGGFYGLHNGPHYLQLDKSFEIFSERIPPSLMPIASDAFGNQICIGISKNRYGQIYFWDHEMEGEGAVERVALSFTEFLSKLYEWEAPDQSKIERIIKKGTLKELISELDNGFGLETEDKNGRTLIENASIQSRNDFVEYLWKRGAKIRNALSLAEKNAEFFEEHKSTVALLRRLSAG